MPIDLLSKFCAIQRASLIFATIYRDARPMLRRVHPPLMAELIMRDFSLTCFITQLLCL